MQIVLLATLRDVPKGGCFGKRKAVKTALVCSRAALFIDVGQYSTCCSLRILIVGRQGSVFSFLREKFFLSSRGYKVNSLHADEIFFTFGIVETILAESDYGCINVRKIFPDPKTKGVPIEVIHRKYQSTWAGKGPLLSF